MTSQRAIAHLAGVSQISVSRALSGKPGLGRTVRDRILRITHQLGYRADPVMSTIARGRWRRRLSDQLRVAVIELSSDPGLIASNRPLATAAMQELATRGMMCDQVHAGSEAGMQQLQRAIASRGYHGAVVLQTQATAKYARLDWSRLPVVHRGV